MRTSQALLALALAASSSLASEVEIVPTAYSHSRSQETYDSV